MPVWWTKRSLPPSSGVTKPKPFSSLNHFTVPVAMVFLYPSRDVRALANAEGATEQRLRALGTSLPGSVPGLVDGNVAASGLRNWRRHGRRGSSAEKAAGAGASAPGRRSAAPARGPRAARQIAGRRALRRPALGGRRRSRRRARPPPGGAERAAPERPARGRLRRAAGVADGLRGPGPRAWRSRAGDPVHGSRRVLVVGAGRGRRARP